MNRQAPRRSRRKHARRWRVNDKDQWNTQSIMYMDKLKIAVREIKRKRNNFGWFEEVYSCECHAPKCFACLYQAQQRQIQGLTEQRRKLREGIRMIDTGINDIMLAQAVKDKLSIADTPAVTAAVTYCASQESLEKKSRSEMLKQLQVTTREQLLKKLRAETPWTTHAVKDNEFATYRQKPKCKSKNHPSRSHNASDGLNLQETEEARAKRDKISAACAEDGEKSFFDRCIEKQLRLLNETIAEEAAGALRPSNGDARMAWLEHRREILLKMQARERCKLMHRWPIGMLFPDSLWEG